MFTPPLFLAVLATWSNSDKLPRDESYLLALREFLPGYVNYLKEIGFYPLDDREREDFLRRARSVGFVDLSGKIAGLSALNSSNSFYLSPEMISDVLNKIVPPYFLRFVGSIDFVGPKKEENHEFSSLGRPQSDGWVDLGLVIYKANIFGNLRSAHIMVPAIISGISSDLFGVEDPRNLSPEQQSVYSSLTLGLISISTCHELGHVVYRTLDKRSLEGWMQISKDGVCLSEYVARCKEESDSLGAEEDFTESFSMFTNNLWQLLSLSSSRFHFMLDMYRNYMGTESFTSFLQGVTNRASDLIRRLQLTKSIMIELANKGYDTVSSLVEIDDNIRACESLLEVLEGENGGGQ